MKILIIDDDNFFQKFYANKLREAGYEVSVASDGEEGWGKIKTASPDLILLDLIMPKKDGFDVLRLIKNDEKIKKIPVIVFSTLDQKEEMEEAKKLGAKEFINKGIGDFSSTLAQITSLIHK